MRLVPAIHPVRALAAAAAALGFTLTIVGGCTTAPPPPELSLPDPDASQSRFPGASDLPAALPPAQTAKAAAGSQTGGDSSAPSGAASPLPASPLLASPRPAAGTPPGGASVKSRAPEPGLYRCEDNRRALIRRTSDDGRSIIFNWQGHDHVLQATAGADERPAQWRDDRSGLAWEYADGRGLVLDLRQGQRLARECRL
jgi:hypothetical protein